MCYSHKDFHSANFTPEDFMFFFFNDTATTEIYTLSLHDALPIYQPARDRVETEVALDAGDRAGGRRIRAAERLEEHTSELQSQSNLVCRLLLEKKKNGATYFFTACCRWRFIKCKVALTRDRNFTP